MNYLNKMEHFKKEILKTTDGSNTIYIPEMDETYHSHHGALAESKHIFIKTGLKHIDKKIINVFEVGFGTGLNAILTCLAGDDKRINYDTIELYPVSADLIDQVEYKALFKGDEQALFSQIHDCKWEEKVSITDQFNIHKIEADFTNYNYQSKYDLIYFDAFAPNKQEEMWTEELLQKLYDACNEGAVLVTYCVRGTVKRALKKVGFQIKKMPGPVDGKREMLRAIKI
jgi:tRNA U34 5-methylaminomethyl-2-thiouridine-forming methyltransferase MnmC